MDYKYSLQITKPDESVYEPELEMIVTNFIGFSPCPCLEHMLDKIYQNIYEWIMQQTMYGIYLIYFTLTEDLVPIFEDTVYIDSSLAPDLPLCTNLINNWKDLVDSIRLKVRSI